MDKFIIFIGVVAMVAIGWAIGFGIFAGFTWLVCWSFDLTFTWKYAFGAWLIWMLISGVFKVTVNNSKKCKTDRWGE